jgi:glycosyltransferase involved in cell wall biosynthesis
MSTIRVLWVIQAPVWGGLYNLAAQVSPRLRDHGFEVIIAAPHGAIEAIERLNAAGVATVSAKLSRLRRTRDPRTHARFIATIASETSDLAKLVTELDIDLVQGSGFLNFHGCIASRKADRPFVLQLNSSSAPFVLRFFFAYLYGRASDSVMIEGRRLLGAYPGLAHARRPIEVFYPGIDSAVFQVNPARRAEARLRLGIADSELVVGVVGNHVWTKGHDIFVKTAERLNRSSMPMRFVIAGTKVESNARYYEREVVARARQSGLLETNLLQFVDPLDDVPGLMAAFDIYFLSSRAEGVGTSTLEAMSIGLPVVAFDVGSVPDVVEEGKTGYVIPLDDDEAAANVILALARRPDLRTQFGAEARRAVRDRFSVAECAERHAAAYRAAIRG